jgi:hypothetical protein
MKQPKTATENARPKTLDTLTEIAGLAMAYRFPDRVPTLSDIARVTAVASRCLHIKDTDERISCENAAVLALGKKLAVIS